MKTKLLACLALHRTFFPWWSNGLLLLQTALINFPLQLLFSLFDSIYFSPWQFDLSNSQFVALSFCFLVLGCELPLLVTAPMTLDFLFLAFDRVSPMLVSCVYGDFLYICFFLLIMIFLLCRAHALKHCNSEQLSKSCTDVGFCSFWQISTKNVESPLRSSLNSAKISHFFLWMTTIRLPPNVHPLSNTTQGHLHCLSSTFIYAFWLALSHLDPRFLVSLLFVSSTWRCYMKRDTIIFYEVSVGLGTW